MRREGALLSRECLGQCSSEPPRTVSRPGGLQAASHGRRSPASRWSVHCKCNPSAHVRNRPSNLRDRLRPPSGQAPPALAVKLFDRRDRDIPRPRSDQSPVPLVGRVRICDSGSRHWRARRAELSLHPRSHQRRPVHLVPATATGASINR
jgi:hypothetical protein